MFDNFIFIRYFYNGKYPNAGQCFYPDIKTLIISGFNEYLKFEFQIKTRRLL